MVNVNNINRITILGIKGGVGKSTVALTLGKALAISSKSVLIVDRDLIGYSSYILGIRGKGILSKLVDGEEDFDSSFKEIALNEGFLGIIKLFGDGYRFENDIDTIHKNKPLREKFSSLYKKFLLYRNYDYYIVDNPPMITSNSDIAKHELEIFYSVFENTKNMRIYVTNYSENSILNTVDYLKNVENNTIYSGIPLAFIINLVPNTTDELQHVKTRLEKIISNLNIGFGLAIPLNEKLINFSGSIIELPIPNEINELAKNIIDKKFGYNKILSESPKSLEKILIPNNVILIEGPPDSRKVNLVLNISKMLNTNNKKLILISTHDKLYNMLKNQNIDFSNISILPKYREERFMLKNIADVIKLSKRLSNEILDEIKNLNNPLIILYRTNDITPASNCCDLHAERMEFWNSFINYIRYKKDSTIILICDKIDEDCNEIESYVDYSIYTFENGEYEIREIL